MVLFFNQSTIQFMLLVALCCKDAWSQSVDHEIRTGREADNRIVGGEEVGIRDYPYTAFLYINCGDDFRECGGAILDQFYILTTASCLRNAQFAYARIATPDKFFGRRNYNTSAFYIHPMFDEKTFDYDVAIVAIDEAMDLDGIDKISLVKSGNDPIEDEDEIIVTGWGNTKENGGATEYLRAAKIPIVSREKCSEQLSFDITPRMFCAGTEEGPPSPCDGDGGDPAKLSVNGKLAGMVSFGLGCGRPGIPHVYTRIGDEEIRAYIKDMINI